MVTASTPNQRYVRGTTNTTKLLAPASTMINPGDFIYDTGTGTAGVCSAFSWGGSTAATQQSFAASFVGVAMDQRIASDATTGQYILVLTDGIFQYPCAALSGALDIGSYFGPAKDTGNNLLDQQLASVGTGGSSYAIAKTVEYAANGATSVLVHIRGTLPMGAIS